MLERYLQLLDKIKEKQLSKAIYQARQSILTKLHSEKFSLHVQEHLAGIQAIGQPFLIGPHEPADITRIKQLINALYFAELALHDVETVNLRDGSQKLADIRKLYSQTFRYIYQACYLVTHIDIDLTEIFAQEFALLTPIFHRLQTWVENSTEETKRLVKKLPLEDLAREGGVLTGIVVDQLGLQGSEIDYEFLTQLGAVIPGYLDRLTKFLERFSSNVSSYEPSLDKKKLDELQASALQLLQSLEQFHGSRIFLSLKTLHFIHIIRHTITLSMSIIEQASFASDTSQEALCAKLDALKYKWLPALFAFIDKLETQSMLSPGTLSKPLYAKLKPWYDVLISYAAKWVEFKGDRLVLLDIKDSRFIEARLDFAVKRHAEEEDALFLLREEELAGDAFFAQLSELNAQGRRLADLFAEQKQQLSKYYKMIQAHVMVFAPSSHRAIAQVLSSTVVMDESLARTLGRILGIKKDELISDILKLAPLLKGHLLKIKNNHAFHQQLINDSLHAMVEDADEFKLWPYRDRRNPLVIHDASPLKQAAEEACQRLKHEPATALQIEALASNQGTIAALEAHGDNPYLELRTLSLHQGKILYRFYQQEMFKLEQADRAYRRFRQLLAEVPHPCLLSDLDEASKHTLGHLYGLFQAHFVFAHPFGQKLDALIVSSLLRAPGERVKGKKGARKPTDLSIAYFLEQDQVILEAFVRVRDDLLHRQQRLTPWLRKKIRQQAAVQAFDLSEEVNPRKSYVLKRSDYSSKVLALRQSLDKLKILFNTSVRSQLNPAAQGLPFPELDDMHKALAESGQILGLKRLFNCLYYVEAALEHFQALNDQSTQTVYVNHMRQAGLCLYDAYYLAQALAQSPYLVVVMGECKEKLQMLYHTMMTLHQHYIPLGAVDGGVDLSPERYPSLFYSMTAMMVLPEHIIALRANKDLSAEELQALHANANRVSLDIERIIARSDSYFKLFFEIPTMYRLFYDLRYKLSKLTTTSHDAVMDHLREINTEVLTNMLLEADRCEDDLGLNPGSLTSSMKVLFDTFYRGLLGPLRLSSAQCIERMSDTLPFEKREAAASLRIDKARAAQDLLRANQILLNNLLTRINYYKSLSSDGDERAMAKMMLIEAFYHALPILQETKLPADVSIVAGDMSTQVLDRVLNESVLSTKPFVHIELLTQTTINYLDGLLASHQLTLAAAQEKLNYLHALRRKHPDDVAQFIESYTRDSFQRQFTLIAKKPVGLAHCSREYSEQLGIYLQSFEDDIVKQAKQGMDIDEAIQCLLCEKAQQFEADHYHSYYHLNVNFAALRRLQQYINLANDRIQRQKELFESAQTLAKKSTLADRLESMLMNQEQSVQQRLQAVKAFVQAPHFRTTVMSYQYENRYRFAWLERWILKIAQLLRLYTPEREKTYRQISQAVESPPENIGQLGARFGLFSAQKSQRAYQLPMLRPVSDGNAPSAPTYAF